MLAVLAVLILLTSLGVLRRFGIPSSSDTKILEPSSSDTTSLELLIIQFDAINTGMHGHRPVGSQTGDPLEVTIVCVYPKDLEKPENDRLKPGSGITSVDWYQHRPICVGGQQAGRFWIPSGQIYLLTDKKGAFGKTKGPSLRGATEDGWNVKKIGEIEFVQGLHDDNAMIYVFPRFIGPTGDVLPVKPAIFNPPGAYRGNLFVEIGVQDGGDNFGQFIRNTTKRRWHGNKEDD